MHETGAKSGNGEGGTGRTSRTGILGAAHAGLRNSTTPVLMVLLVPLVLLRRFFCRSSAYASAPTPLLSDLAECFLPVVCVRASAKSA